MINPAGSVSILDKEFTLKELLEFTSKSCGDIKVFNSCMTLDYSISVCLKDNPNDDFESISDVIRDGNKLMALYDFSNKYNPIDINGLRLIPYLDMKIERDVEDNYVFENYDKAILTDKILVLL